MADIALRSYLKHIDQLIDQKDLDEALAYCRNTLNHFPKCVEAYRLMGKALLERGRHGDAADIFQRVLSATPDDFISHVGMAIVREDEANIDAALWHMERAFEANPANPAIQDELRRLYGRRDGLVPPRAQLTRGALARLYFRGGLFTQAETELRAGLQEHPDRPDLKVLLIQVLWESNRRVEAAEMAAHLLETLPHCLEANRILAEHLTAQNRLEEARPYRQRIEALDPYEAYASLGLAAGHVNADAIKIAEVSYAPELGETGNAAWANSLGADVPAQDVAMPEWVRSGTSLLTGNLAETPASPEAVDWMREAGFTAELSSNAPALTPAEVASTATASVSPESDTVDFATPDWLVAASQDTAGDGEDLPDWLRSAAADSPTAEAPEWTPPAVTAPETPAPATPDLWADLSPGFAGGGALASEPLPEARPAANPTADGLPDWLHAAAQTGPLSDDGAAATEDAPDLPAWLAGGTTEMEADGAPAWLQTGMPDLAPDWLKASDITATPDGLTAQAQAQPALPEATPPSPAQPMTLDPNSSDDASGAEAQEALPAWLANADPEGADMPAWLHTDDAGSTPEADGMPDWLAPTSPQPTIGTPPTASTGSETDRAPDRQPQPEHEENEIPEWLRQASVQTGPLGAAPDWLAADDTLGLTAPETSVRVPAQRPGPAAPWATASPVEAEDSDLPDWLRQAASTRDQATSTDLSTSDELAWLRADSPTASAPAESDRAAGSQSESFSLSEVELPDFLQPASPEAIARAEMPVDWESAEGGDEPPAPEEAQPELDAAVPDWVQALAPSADQLASLPERSLEVVPGLSDDDLPEWLRSPASPSTVEIAETAISAEATIEPSLETTAPDATDLSTDDALAWLEGLALQQGVDPAELGQQPAMADATALEIPTVPATPVMATSEGVSDPTFAAATPDSADLSTDDALAWLEGLALQQGVDPAELGQQPAMADATALEIPTVPATPVTATSEGVSDPTFAAATPDSADLSTDDALAWLEGLALQQGVDPAELGQQPALADATALEIPTVPATPVTATSEGVSDPTFAAATSDSADLSTDDALAWLEGLALQQGVDPAELGQQPAMADATALEVVGESLGAATPVTATSEGVSDPTFAAATSDSADLSTDDVLAWLEGLALQQGVDPAELGQQPAMADATALEVVGESLGAATPEATSPDTVDLSTDDALAWLETLALQQGTDSAELGLPSDTTTVKDGIAESISPAITDTQPLAPMRLDPPALEGEPETEATGSMLEHAAGVEWLRAPLATTAGDDIDTDLPDWASEATQTKDPAIPAWVQPVDEHVASPEASVEPAPAEPVKRTSLLADKLAERRRAKEAEIQARFDAQRESREAAQRDVEARLAARRAALSGEGTTPAPASAFSLRPTEPLPASDPVVPTGGQALTASALARAGTGPLGVPGATRTPPAFAGVEPRDLLERCRAQLIAGQEAFAFEGFAHLIKQGVLLDAVTIDLERYAAGRTPSALALRCLGDVYMRAGRLQNALDAYRQALESL